MRINEVLTESISFDVAQEETRDDGQVVGAALGSEQEVECDICDGTGKDVYPDATYKCGMCNGTGKYSRFVEEGPTMNLANSNALALLRAVGIEADWSGRVQHKDLPALKRKLMMLLNSDKAQQGMTTPATDNDKERPMGTTQNADGTASIGRQGPRIIGGGRDADYVKRAASNLLKIVDFASKNPKYFLSWG